MCSQQIAAIFEFSGALLLGRVSTNTIAGGIADINAFTANPEVYAYGMVCALTIGTIWQVLSSYMGLNTSSTHTISKSSDMQTVLSCSFFESRTRTVLTEFRTVDVDDLAVLRLNADDIAISPAVGAIIGFALVWDGKNAVVWAQKDPSGSTFPPYKGVVSIVMAWFVAPILTGATAALIFGLVRFLVLRRKNAYAMSFWCLPPMVLVTVFINVYFVFTKGAKKALTSSKSSDWNDSKSAWISIVIASGVAVLTAIIILPLLKRHCERLFDANGRPIAHIDGTRVDETEKVPGEGQYKGEGEHDAIDTLEPGQVVPAKRDAWHQRAWQGATHGVNVDIHKVVKTNAAVNAIHERAEVFEPRVEYAFSYLQVY